MCSPPRASQLPHPSPIRPCRSPSPGGMQARFSWSTSIAACIHTEVLSATSSPTRTPSTSTRSLSGRSAWGPSRGRARRQSCPVLLRPTRRTHRIAEERLPTRRLSSRAKSSTPAKKCGIFPLALAPVHASDLRWPARGVGDAARLGCASGWRTASRRHVSARTCADVDRPQSARRPAPDDRHRVGIRRRALSETWRYALGHRRPASNLW
jgi:hypothetical protein